MRAIKVKQGLSKRKVRVDSKLEDGVVKRKGDRIQGEVNWADQEFTTLLDIMAELLPAGKNAWGEVYSCFEAWVKEHGHPVHSESMVEICFKAVSHCVITSMC